MEASGTSGMKVLPNGGINLSIPDGWWAEVEDPETGWTIGSGEDYADQDYGDIVEANTIYDLLEREIVPLFYDRTNKIPRKWVEKMRLSMMKLSAEFNTNRMVRDYTNDFYLPTIKRFTALSEDNFSRAKTLADWRVRVENNWKGIRVEAVNVKLADSVLVGDEVAVEAVIRLCELKPEDVSVQVYFGKLNDARQIINGQINELKPAGEEENRYVYKGSFHCDKSGRHGYALRIIPRHEDLANAVSMGFIHWHNPSKEESKV